MQNQIATQQAAPLSARTTVATNRDVHALMAYEANKKSLGASYVLWFFLGGLGGHRFYNGRTGSGVAQLLMTIFGIILIAAGGIGILLLLPVSIWVLVDAFLIPGWVSGHNNMLAVTLSK